MEQRISQLHKLSIAGHLAQAQITRLESLSKKASQWHVLRSFAHWLGLAFAHWPKVEALSMDAKQILFIPGGPNKLDEWLTKKEAP